MPKSSNFRDNSWAGKSRMLLLRILEKYIEWSLWLCTTSKNYDSRIRVKAHWGIPFFIHSTYCVWGVKKCFVLPFPRSPVPPCSPVLPFPPSPVPPFSRSPVLPFSRSPVLPFSRSSVPPFSRSPFLVLLHSFSVPCSPFLVLRSLFSVPRSPFLLLRSPYSVPPTPFPILRSSFSVSRSPFPALSLPFPVPPLLELRCPFFVPCRSNILLLLWYNSGHFKQRFPKHLSAMSTLIGKKNLWILRITLDRKKVSDWFIPGGVNWWAVANPVSY